MSEPYKVFATQNDYCLEYQELHLQDLQEMAFEFAGDKKALKVISGYIHDCEQRIQALKKMVKA